MPALHAPPRPAAAPPFGAHPPRPVLARRRLGIGPACFVVLASHLHAGRLAPRAGLDTVIVGVARLRQRHGIDAMLLVAVGAGADADADADAMADTDADAELARLRELVRALAMTAHVRFVVAASLNSLRDWHAAADVLVSTPWRMADTGIAMEGGRDAARGRATAVVLPPRDAETLTAHLARLQRRRAPAQVTGDANRVTLTAPCKAPA